MPYFDTNSLLDSVSIFTTLSLRMHNEQKQLCQTPTVKASHKYKVKLPISPKRTCWNTQTQPTTSTVRQAYTARTCSTTKPNNKNSVSNRRTSPGIPPRHTPFPCASLDSPFRVEVYKHRKLLHITTKPVVSQQHASFRGGPGRRVDAVHAPTAGPRSRRLRP